MKLSIRLTIAIVAGLATTGCFETAATQIGCSASDQRCVPIGLCPSEYTRLKSLMGSPSLREEYGRVKCTPERQIKQNKYVCCQKRDIDFKCKFYDQPGVCVPRGNCPTQNLLTKHQQLAWSTQQPCYVHNGREYLCCTYDKCIHLPKVCDKEIPAPKLPGCTNNGVEGSLVPKMMCVTQDQLNQSRNSHVCCVPPMPDRLMSRPKAAQLANMPCGMFDNGPLIQNGEFAHRGEFPWMAYLVYKTKQWRCGGTLIHPSYVLTAKHCMKRNAKPTHVMLGVHDALDTPPCSRTSREPYCSQVQKISVARIFTHNEFDIALLRLSRKATLVQNSVYPICLPLYASLRMELPERVLITGWGLTEENIVSNVLLKATTPVAMRGTDCPSDHLICVGGKNNSHHCHGDSGGPYQKISPFGDDNRYVQYGVISSGSQYCSVSNELGKGMLVSYFLDWILDNMAL